ncbi:HAD-IA family hydrolase [Bacillus sp. Marseille-Q3570]|uniref:HAD-IA family hydrolase n=1 Tax=Bacillus sp. Marseille-Q3570 TaxID=2963522 RepID=UPI0021B7BE18|nr:HAD-IA family hydrolase [Bacillus sp. Marseille-Q3570]
MNILWDFDGTLVDSYRLFVKLFKQVLGDDTTEEEILSHIKVSFTHAFEYYGFSEKLKEEFRALEDELEPSEFIPFEYLEKVLEIADHNFIVTHNSKKVVKSVMDHHGLTGYFTKIIGYEDEFPRKPDPAAYKYILRDYSIDLVVGDRELDLLPAKELGIATCSFQNDAIEGMDYYVHTYEELYAIIKKNVF